MHFFKNLSNKFKEPFSKHDMKRFLTEGILGSVIFGSVMGAVDYFLMSTALNFLTLFTFIIFYSFLTKRLYRSFSFYHIWYSILAVFFVLLGNYFKGVFANILFVFYHTKGVIHLGLFNPIFYYSFLYMWALDPITIIYNIASIAIYAYICYITFVQMKR